MRAHLNEEPHGYCTAERDAINLSVPQFFEKAAHNVDDLSLIIIWCGAFDRQMDVQSGLLVQ